MGYRITYGNWSFEATLQCLKFAHNAYIYCIFCKDSAFNQLQ